MILRRLSTALRKQDWFTVVIETLIVVLGVFLGLQVNNWNEARSANRAEAELRMTLEQDFAQLETQLTDSIQTLIALQEDVSELLSLVRADTAPTDIQATIALLDAAWTIPRLPSPPASYVETISTGRLSTLSDPELRRALSQYGQSVELHQLTIPLSVETITGRDSRIVQSIHMVNDLEAMRLNVDGGIEAYDWEILKDADADVQMTLVWMLTAEVLAQQQQQEVETILESLRESAP